MSKADRFSRLPKRFPVGSKYIVEARGGEHGDLRILSRYVVLPGGRRINLAVEPSRSAPRAMVCRNADAKPSQSKSRSGRMRQKIAATRGTKRRSCR